MTRGELVAADGEASTREGLWLRLDHATLERHCYDQAGQAWCLARTAAGFVFLRRETEEDSESEETPASGSAETPIEGSGAMPDQVGSPNRGHARRPAASSPGAGEDSFEQGVVLLGQ